MILIFHEKIPVEKIVDFIFGISPFLLRISCWMLQVVNHEFGFFIFYFFVLSVLFCLILVFLLFFVVVVARIIIFYENNQIRIYTHMCP